MPCTAVLDPPIPCCTAAIPLLLLQDFPSDVYGRVVEAVKADESMAGKSEKEVRLGPALGGHDVL